MTLEEAFGLVLRRQRTRKGISQEKLAFEGNLDRTFISLLERGLRQPSLKSMLLISYALEIKPSDFLDLVEQEITRNKVSIK